MPKHTTRAVLEEADMVGFAWCDVARGYRKVLTRHRVKRSQFSCHGIPTCLGSTGYISYLPILRNTFRLRDWSTNGTLWIRASLPASIYLRQDDATPAIPALGIHVFESDGSIAARMLHCAGRALPRLPRYVDTGHYVADARKPMGCYDITLPDYLSR